MKSVLEMENDLKSFGIPIEKIPGLFDAELSLAVHKPILSLIAFDDYLHKRFGNYESEGKSMSSLFDELFGSKSKEIASYFGV